MFCLANIRSTSNILCQKQNQKNTAELAIKVRSTCIRFKKKKGGGEDGGEGKKGRNKHA